MRLVRSLALAAALSLSLGVAAQAQAADLYKGARKITPGTPVPYGRGVLMGCKAEGVLTLVMSDGSLLETYVFAGTSQLDGFAVQDVNAAGTTATCTVSVLG